MVFASFALTSHAQLSSLPNGFPSNDAGDGKLLVASQGLSSLGAAPADGTVFNVHIRVPISTPVLNIEIFDPDLFSDSTDPGYWDFPPLDLIPLLELIPGYKDSTRFELYPDVDITGNTTVGQIHAMLADSSMDNQWIDFFNGSPFNINPGDPAACEQGPDAQFCFYHLVARWVDATPPNNPKVNATTAGGNVLNGFIVATNGQGFLSAGSTIGIMGMTDQSSAFPVPSTNYDGTFGLRALVTSPQGDCALDIYDGDADRAGSALSLIYPDETDDPNTPGNGLVSGFLPFTTSADALEEGVRPGLPADNNLASPFLSIGVPIFYTVAPEPPTLPYGVDCCVNDNPSGDKEWELFRIASTASGCPDVNVVNYDPDDKTGSGGINGPAPAAVPDRVVDAIGPGFHLITLGGMDPNNLNFLNVSADIFSGEAFDFGDAPDSYQTTISANGPSHDIDARLTIGVELDAEIDGVPSATSNGDDTNLVDDEDGISSFDLITTDLAGSNYSVEVAVRNELDPGNVATLFGWIDFDDDGTFESTESASVPVNPGDTTATLVFVVPGNVSAANTHARFRLTTDTGISTTTPGGAAQDGEVEDYPLTIGDGEECIPCKGMKKLVFEMSDWGGGRDTNEIVRVRVGDLTGKFSGNDFNAPILFEDQVPNGGIIEINVPDIHLGKTLTISVEGNNHETETGKSIFYPDCELRQGEKSGNSYIKFKVVAFEKDSDEICECEDESENGEFCPPVKPEGCTPGYWKQPHHFDSWTGYDPADLFRHAFGKGPLHTLKFSLSNGGGGLIAFRRHATAALLNAANPEVNYFKTEAEVIESVRETFKLVWSKPKNERKALWVAAKNVFREQNQMGCPLN